MRKRFSHNNTISKQGYKFEDVCAGLRCNNKAIITLKVKYINKTGHFCHKCRDDLLQSELAEEIKIEGHCIND